MRIVSLFMVLMLPAFSLYAQVVGQPVDYKVGDQLFKGYIAYDDTIKEKRPGILVVHEWWGHNDYARKRADMLAAAGYTAFALDMYGDGKVADHPGDAGKFAGEVNNNLPAATDRFNAAKNLLSQHPSVESGDISAIGYCFGGGVVLAMARQGMDLDLVASFHGSLGPIKPAEKGMVKSKLLVYNGADDPFVKAETIEAFKAEMEAAEVNYSFHSYPGAVHAFTNPDADINGEKFNLPLAYNAVADEQSWADFMRELKATYK